MGVEVECHASATIPERRTVPVVEETRWAPGPSAWIRGRESLFPSQGFEPRTRWALGPSAWISGGESLLPSQGFEPLTVQLLDSHYTG